MTRAAHAPESIPPVVIMGAGLAGCTAALELGRLGHRVTLLDRMPRPMMGASRHNEGKLHLGYVYAADPQGKTHKGMASGALRFLDILARLTGSSLPRDAFSDPFTYIVPTDSALSVDEIATHVQRVDETTAALSEAFGLVPLPKSAMVPAHLLHRHFSEKVIAAFRTPEIAVDPAQVARLVSAAILARPMITFRGSCAVLGAEPAGADGFRITVDAAGTRVDLAAHLVVNALWEDRIRLDAMVGLPAPAGWSQRWKATIVMDAPGGERLPPSTTAIVGPYGDLVTYGGRRIYASWYPVCRLAMSATAAQVRAAVAATDRHLLTRGALAGLATLIPGVAALARATPTAQVGGGFIVARGTTDIDDAESALHQRHEIGVTQTGNWVSISTGKFCTAPIFGVQAAQAIAGRLR